MRRAAVLCISMFIGMSLAAQTPDRALIESHQCAVQSDTVSRSVFNSFAHTLRNQLYGVCRYVPECVDFYAPAVRELGFIRGTLSTVDRMTRCGRIGTAANHSAASDGRIHEGTEAYRRRGNER